MVKISHDLWFQYQAKSRIEYGLLDVFIIEICSC